jgi:hypothetical protein
MADKILFVGRRRTTDMPSVEGVDDDVPPRGFGVYGHSSNHLGVQGTSNIDIGVQGIGYTGIGVYGGSDSGLGVSGRSNSSNGVDGYSNSGNGVEGLSNIGYGVYGHTRSGIGVVGSSTIRPGVVGISADGDGVQAYSYRSDTSGVYGRSTSGTGVYGHSDIRPGVVGVSADGDGVQCYSYRSDKDRSGVYGYSTSGTGVYGHSDSGDGVVGISTSGYAAYLDGKVFIRGPLTKPAGQFKIDHPLDPANKYLSHSFVESPDMKNVYDGIVILDDKGEAKVDLPDWFSALNKDFRYQLTAIGAPGPNLYIAEEISDTTTTTNYTSSSNNSNNNSRFKIAGGTSAMKVSWQVTGIRKDPFANAHRIQVEGEKPDKERGYYLHPDLYSQPEEKGISYLLFPKDKREEVLARAVHK